MVTAALLPPLVFVAFPSLLMRFEFRATGVALAFLLLLAPALAGLAVARIGLVRIAKARRQDGDVVVAVWRIFFGLLLFGYAVVLQLSASGRPSCLAAAAAGLIAAWLVLVPVINRTARRASLRHAVIAADAALLSAFLYCGGGDAAVSFPLYLLVVFYSGWQFGLEALAAAAGVSIAGFAVVIATSPFWRERPALAVGAILVLAIAAAGMARLLRAVAAAQRSAATGAAGRNRALAVASDALQQALVTVPPVEGPAALTEIRGRLHDIGNLVSLAAGTFAAENEPFDLHALVNDTIAEFSGAGGNPGTRPRIRLDPAIPFRLRGPHRQLARILHNLLALGAERQGGSPLRLSINAPAIGSHGLRLQLSLRGTAAVDPDMARLAVIEQLVRSIAGDFEIPAGGADERRILVVLPMALDTVVPEPLDLADRPVLIVGDDSQFAGEFAEPLHSWRADVRWIGGCEAALDYLERFEAPTRPVLVVDACSAPLPALSFVHRAARARFGVPFIVLIAAASDAERIGALAADACDSVLSAPDAIPLLGNALHALPLDSPVAAPAAAKPDPTPGVEPSVQPLEPSVRPVPVEDRVTPITVHPRFLADPVVPVDPATVASLRALAGGDDFLGELIEAFREEARPLLQRIADSAAEADLEDFRAALTALSRCARNVGGTRLAELALALRDASSDGLPREYDDAVHRLGAELARVEAALTDLLDSPQLRRQ